MQVRKIAVLLVGIASGSLAACSRGPTPGRVPAPDDPGTRVTVDNNNWLDVVVYAVRSGARFRLGMVPGLSSETLRVPPGLGVDGTVSLLVDPIGSNIMYATDQITVAPGQRVELTVRNRLSMSSFSVWRH